MAQLILTVKGDDNQLMTFAHYLNLIGFRKVNKLCGYHTYIQAYDDYTYLFVEVTEADFIRKLPEHYQFAVSKIEDFTNKKSKSGKKEVMEYYDIYEGDFVKYPRDFMIAKVESIEHVSSISTGDSYSHIVREYFDENGPHWIIRSGHTSIPIDLVEKVLPTDFKVSTRDSQNHLVQHQPVVDSSGDLNIGCFILSKERLNQIKQVAEFCDLHDVELHIDGGGSIIHFAYAGEHIEEPIALEDLEDLEEAIEKINKSK